MVIFFALTFVVLTRAMRAGVQFHEHERTTIVQ